MPEDEEIVPVALKRSVWKHIMNLLECSKQMHMDDEDLRATGRSDSVTEAYDLMIEHIVRGIEEHDRWKAKRRNT